MHNKTYCNATMDATIKAEKRTATTGARHRRIHKKHRMNMCRRARLEILEAEEQIRLDGVT